MFCQNPYGISCIAPHHYATRFQRNVVDVLTARGPKRAISRNTIVRISRVARSTIQCEADEYLSVNTPPAVATLEHISPFKII